MRTALVLLLMAPALALAQAGRLLLSAGEVTVVRGTQEIRAVAGTAVEPGDTIRVGPRSGVQLRMSDQSIISLRSNTVFRIDEYVYRGDDDDRSIFSLVKGGMRTVGGAIARQPSEGLIRAAARPEPTGRPPAAEEKKPERDSKIVDLIRAPLRTVAGAVTPTRHAVRVPTATIGVRGTHYTLVHCDNDCFEPRRTTVAWALLAQSDAGSPGVGTLAPNGTYGGVSNGAIVVINNRDDKEIGANGFFYVASIDSLVQSLIGPPSFLYDRLEAQERRRGQTAIETTANMLLSGLNAESRPSEIPIPREPPAFIVTEVRDTLGGLVVLGGVAPNTAFLSAFTHSSGTGDVEGAFIDASALTTSGSGTSQTLDAFAVPAGTTINLARGSYTGSAPVGTVTPGQSTNALNAYWGVWAAGSEDDLLGRTAFSANNKFHYLVGPNTPPEVVASKSGTFTMVTFGAGTSPTNNLGESITFPTGSTITVDFTTRTAIFSAIAFGFAREPWTFPASAPSPIIVQAGRGAYVQSATIGSCGPVTDCNGSALLTRNGIFMGPKGDHLGVAFQARTLSGTPASMQATQIYTCAPNC